MDIYTLVKTFVRMYPATIAWRLRTHASLAEKILDKDEELRYVFTAQKNDLNKDFMSTNIVMITNERIILVHKRIFPGYFVNAISKKKINDIHLKTGMIWGKITLDTIKEEITLSNIDKRALDAIADNLQDLVNIDLKRDRY